MKFAPGCSLMGRVIRRIVVVVALLTVTVGGYVGVGRMLPGAAGVDAATIWLVGILCGAALVVLARVVIDGGRRSAPVQVVKAGAEAELSELSEEIANVNEPATLYFLLTNRLAAIVGWRRAALFLLDEEKGRYVCRKAAGETPANRLEEMNLRRSDAFIQDIFENRGHQHAPIINLGAAAAGNAQVEALVQAHGFSDFVPLFNRSRLLGFLLVAGRTVLSPHEERELRAVTAQGAAALDTLTLLENEAVDPLTGFMTASFFDSRMEEEMRRSRRLKNRFSVLLLDVDELRVVNDSWGDEAGNEVIQAIAAAMRDKLRKTDVACRLGGEEFAVLLPDTRSDHGKLVAENLRAQVEGLAIHLEEAKAEVRRTISIGIAEYSPDDPTFGDAILQRAQKALLQAKTNGKNTIAVYDESLPL